MAIIKYSVPGILFKTERGKLVNYLKKNKARIEYGRLRRGGYPLGSGAIESSNKFISNIRLKRSGAWWKVDYANNILKLRCGKYNSKFDTFLMNTRKTNKVNEFHGIKGSV